MLNRIFIAALLLLVAGWACAGAGKPEPPSREPAAKTAAEEGLIRFDGRVVYVPVEGGFFGIVSEDGRKYDPRNLPEEFRKDGIAVQVTARPLEGVVGFHMWGKIVDIVEIRKK